MFGFQLSKEGLFCKGLRSSEIQNRVSDDLFYMDEGSVKKAIANRGDLYIVDIRRRVSSKTKNYLQKGSRVMEKVGRGQTEVEISVQKWRLMAACLYLNPRQSSISAVCRLI